MYYGYIHIHIYMHDTVACTFIRLLEGSLGTLVSVFSGCKEIQ